MDETKHKASRTASAARKSISRYCLEECGSYCCRKGFLKLTSRNVDLVTQGKREEFLERGILQPAAESRFVFSFEKNGLSCPSLDKGLCVIHDDPRRPKVCREFPLFIRGSRILISPNCPAVRSNRLFPYLRKLKLLGYEILEERFWIESFDLS